MRSEASQVLPSVARRERRRSACIASAAALVLLLVLAAWAGEAWAQFGGPSAAPSVPALQPPPDLVGFRGRTITRVDVTLDDDTWRDVVIAPVRGVRAGQVFEPALARQLLDEVLGTGRFARGRVAVTSEGAGVRLVAHVVPRKLIETLRVDLHGARVEAEELLRDADLAEGGELIGKDLPEQKARIEALLTRHGYPERVVTITTRSTDQPEQVIVLVEVSPGLPRVIRRRVFYVFDADARALSSTNEAYMVKPGDRADEDALASADTDLVNRLHARGFQHAQVTHDVVEPQGGLTLRVRIDAGALVVPKFVGNDHFDADALNGALALDEDTDRTPGHMAQKIKDFYVKHGFLDAEVTLEQRGAENGSKLVDFVFHIVERERVRVVARLYPCLKEDDIRHLSEAPSSPSRLGNEIDSYLDEELPGADLVKAPDPGGLDALIRGPAEVPRGQVPVPIDLDPDETFSPDTYDRALLHVQELYRNEGYLHARVGPVQVTRRTCDRRSPAGRCVPLPLPRAAANACTYDATNLPLPVPPGDPALSCAPDPSRGIDCEAYVSLRIPIKLGPRTILYDLAFTGVRSIPERALAVAADLTLGEPANVLKLDDARRHIIDAYKEEGFAYVDVKYSLDSSLDHTRALARFDVVEGERVMVDHIVIRGNERTSESVIRKRVALEEGQPYRMSDVRKTEERVATLNVFSSVNVSLEDPYVPMAKKTVILSVVERSSQYLDVRPGMSTGEGFRFAFEYGHRNLFGDAISLSLRIQLSYLPDFLILDDQVRTNYDTAFGYPAFDKRIATRSTATLAFPDVGLGPLVRASVDGVYVRDLERDFALTKEAGIVSFYYRPMRQLQFSLSPDFEANDALVFGAGTVEQYLEQQQAQNQSVNADLARLLRVPTGQSDAVAQRFLVTWDRRDNSFNAHRGTYVAAGVEHVDWGALQEACSTTIRPPYDRSLDAANGWALSKSSTTLLLVNGQPFCEPDQGHFVRFTETLAAYLPVTKTITLAGEIRLGTNVQLVPGSFTYPDRLFFMGGIESMRGWLQDTFVPQDFADRIAADASKPASDPTKFTISQVALRGGNLMINPRFELRVPVRPPLETVLFLDTGNLWSDATYIFSHGITLRAAAGSGVRFQTPIGPVVLDYGVNLSRLASSPNSPRRAYEDFGAFHFAIGLF